MQRITYIRFFAGWKETTTNKGGTYYSRIRGLGRKDRGPKKCVLANKIVDQKSVMCLKDSRKSKL